MTLELLKESGNYLVRNKMKPLRSDNQKIVLIDTEYYVKHMDTVGYLG